MELNPDFRLKIFEIEIDSMEAETYIRKRDQLRAISRSANYPFDLLSHCICIITTLVTRLSAIETSGVEI